MFKNGNALHVFVNIHSKYGKIVSELTPGKQLTPEFLMKLSLRQIKILVDTMIKGDGSFNKKSGRKSFTQNKGKTLETFKMALTMLGISYQDLDKDDKCRHISIRSGKNYCIKRATIERKIYSGRVWCPNIDGNHTWVAMRNGKPFITHNSFYVKALPQLIKVATTHPGRFLPYVLTFKALGMLVAAQNDVDDDDLDKLKKALPEWLQEKGHAYILPVKDAFGRWQAIDLGYFVPWTMYTELLGEAGRGDIGGAMRSLGVLGSPVADLITAVKTGIDPFTRKPIVDKFGTPAEQMGDIFNYLWRMNMPTFITDIGATGKLIEAISGDVDKQGNPKTTVGQALARFAGVNLYGIDPENERAKNIRHRRYEMIEAKAAWRKAVRDPNASESDKENASEHYRELIGDMATDLQQYLKDSEIHPNLKLQKTGV
jgi:hypothetical protein